MAVRQIERRQTKDSTADALLALAASLQDATDADDALNRLTRGLADRDLACAVLVQPAGEDGLRLKRATLPLSADVWGRPLRLPRLLAALKRGRPDIHDDTADAFTEAGKNGTGTPLLTINVPGTLIVAPLRVDSETGGVLCLAGRELNEGDRSAAWGLALQLGVALATASSTAPSDDAAAAVPTASDDGLFHGLTQRLSHSLSRDEVVRAGIDALVPVLGFQLAASVVCQGNEDTITVYAPEKTPEQATENAADAALEAFLKLTGGKHRDCARPALRTNTLAAGKAAAGDMKSALDAPLVMDGEVAGLLHICSAEPDAFAPEKERTFYTVANQISLALERIAAQQRAERAHLASLAESLSDGIVLVDSALQVTSLNSAARSVLASSGGQEEGSALSSPVLAELARTALSSQQPTPLRELPSAAASTGRRYLVAMAAPLAGSPEGSAAVVIVRDVTEERLMQERLVQSEKMVSVGQLVSGVAHELNNPLTGIIGFSQLLLARDLDEQTARDIETIHTEAERAAKIVQNLLSFARRKHTEKELASLNLLLEHVLELRTYDLQVKSIELNLELDPKLPKTMVDTNQIQQVFLNVIINAEQSMLAASGRGTLTVRTEQRDGAIRISFQDDGPGIDEETLRRIFDPFFTTKDVGEGTGLGLTICYGIIDEHNGRIWAESQPGQGSTFIIELPIVAGAARAADPEVEQETAVAARSILVVDDEESIQRLLGSLLEIDGHHVDTASNGREALERIAGRRYDVLITDIKMPGMDGRDLYERLRKEDPALAERTVFITGDTVSPDTRSFLQRVKNPVLAKPFRIREVRETINGILADS
ncbi:MAG: response regulator [Chloroflexi bacterium]|nr:response regulator [Chloroflexota bacterium]